MSTLYNGKSGNVPAFPGLLTLHAVISIGGGLTTIQTTAPHGLNAGDLLDLFNIQDAALNGLFTIVSVPAPDEFAITATAGGTGFFVSGARAQPIAFPTVQEISDADAMSAGNLNPIGEASQDELAFLLGATGSRKLVNIVTVGADFSALGTSWNTFATTVSNAFVLGTHGYDNIFTGTGGSGCIVGDWVELDLDVSVAGATASQYYAVALFSNSITPGGSNNFARIPRATATWVQNGGSLAITPVHLKAILKIGTGSTATGSLQVGIQAASNVAGADTIAMYDSWQLTAKLWRPTSCPQ